MRYTSCEQIREAFIRDDWNLYTTFTEITAEDAKDHVFYIQREMKRGRKFFRMTGSGNIFDDAGKIALYNIKSAMEAVE